MAGFHPEKAVYPFRLRTGKVSSKTSSASSCSSSSGVKVELPQTITSAPSFALMRRTPSTISGPMSSTGPQGQTVRPSGRDEFRRGVQTVGHEALGVRPIVAKDIVGSAAQQQIETSPCPATIAAPTTGSACGTDHPPYG